MNARGRGATRLSDIAFAARCLGHTAQVELRYCRALRLALLTRAGGGSWWRVLRTLTSTYDVSTLCIDGHWFLIGPEDPRHLDRLPELGRWAWYICGPSINEDVNPSLSWEEWAPGFSPGPVLAYCRDWAEVVCTAEQQRQAA